MSPRQDELESLLKWARSLPPDDHVCEWEDVARAEPAVGYRPIDEVCRFCDAVRPTARVLVVR